MQSEGKREALNFLFEFVAERKRELFYEVVEPRTSHITIVLEDIFQSYNVSETLHISENYDVQGIYIIKNKHNINPNVQLGLNKRIDLHRFNDEGRDMVECYNCLRIKDYKIYSTTSHKDGISLFNLLIKVQIALIFEIELSGLTKTVINNADEYVKIPICGFIESFNISVSMVIFLYYFLGKLHRSRSDVDWKLIQEKKLDLVIRWSKNSIRHPGILEKGFIKSNIIISF